MPETTPRRKPNPRLSHGLRNKLPCPHSCISVNARTVNKLNSSTAAAVSQSETWTLIRAAHQTSASDANVVRTCVNPLKLSALACPRIIACFCSLIRSIDDTIGVLRFRAIICREPQERTQAGTYERGTER